jgi:hypothetical protein
MADSPLWAAISAIKDGLSANAGLNAARAAGLGVRRETWLKLYSEAKSALVGAPKEMSAPLNRRPTSAELFAFEAPNARGYLHQVDVYVRDRETGDVSVRPYSIRTDELLIRDDAIATALDAFGGNADRYNEQVLGAAHVGAYVFVPKSS